MALYPPIVASSMPAFEINEEGTGSVKIYFTLSNYNTSQLNEIRAVHVSVRNQASNVDVLIGNKIPGFLRCNIDERTEEDKILNRYSITINSTNIIKSRDNNSVTSGFKPDTFYKVQLRFSGQDINPDELNPVLNLDTCSLWSTVCIIKPVLAPEFHINEFKGFEISNTKGNLTIIQEKSDVIYTYQFADFSAMYRRGNSSLNLKYWRLRLLDDSYTESDYMNIDQFTEADSGWQFSSAYNYISSLDTIYLKCSLPYLFSNSKNYKLLFEIKTRNDYIDSKLYLFEYERIDINPLSGELNTYINNELGYIKVHYNGNLDGNIVLRRTDSRSNFLKWEDLLIFETHNDNGYVYYDFTALSGMAYRYLIQTIDIRGRRGQPLIDNTNNGTVADWDYAYLLLTTGNGAFKGTKQLKLKYDFQISSLKTNILLSKTDTIGSKYPYIRRNGKMYYRSFSCTGTITSYMDNVNLFTSANDLYDNNIDIYKEANNILKPDFVKPNNYDYIYLRKFREAVELFLYNSKPKLYKSTQEGNMLVKLMLVSLTPKNELGRLIYTFSATAYEVDLYSIQNLNAYNFITIGAYSTTLLYPDTKLGQLSTYTADGNEKGNIFKGGSDIIGKNSNSSNSIAKKLKYNESFNGYVLKDFQISYLRIVVDSLPYFIILTLNGLLPYNDGQAGDSTDGFGSVEEKLYQIKSVYENKNSSEQFFNVYLGTLFYLTSQNHTDAFIISYPNNIYLLKDLNLLLDTNSFQIIPARDTIMTVDYVANLSYLADASSVASKIRTLTKVGQLIGTYDSTQLIVNMINYKYIAQYGSSRQRIFLYVNGILGLSIDTLPNTVVAIKTNAFDSFANEERFVVNETGLLDFDFYNYNNIKITSFRILGINIDSRDITDKGSVNTVEDLPTIVNQRLLYTVIENGKKYIFYKNKYYEAIPRYSNSLAPSAEPQLQSYDVQCPVDAMIFYTVRVESDYY